MLFVLLLVVMIGAFGAYAYRGVRDAATLRASERLVGIARELGTSATRSGAARLVVLQDIARDSIVVRTTTVAAALPQIGGDASAAQRLHTTGVADSAAGHAIDRLFTSRRVAADSTVMAVQIWTAAGDRRYGPSLHDADSVQLAQTMRRAYSLDSAQRSPLYVVGSQLRLWTVVPIRQGSTTTGFLAEQRYVGGSPQAETLLKKLTGEDVQLFYASRGSTEWGSIRGLPVQSPIGRTPVEQLPIASSARVANATGDPVYAAAGAVAGAPWRIVLVQTEESILAPPHAFLRELLLIGALILLLGAVAAWWLSRLETRPLRDLRRAAEAMAGGEYGQTVTPAGGAETAALADAFNTMSLQISDTHATLREQNEALVQANESKARFLAVMSHELRTPLNAIGGYAELLALGVHGPVTPAQQEAMRRIARSKDQLLHLVSDILHYSRLEASPMLLTCSRIPLQAVFDGVRDNVAEQFAQKCVALAIEPTDAVVFADDVRVYQILTNLVVNALKFTPANGSVKISADSDGVRTIVQVVDTGEGIAPELHASIFEPFVQADDSLTRRSGGAGLGLAIVRQLATAMSGTVTVKSAVGHGATFIVTLPCGAKPTDEAEPTPTTVDADAVAVATH